MYYIDYPFVYKLLKNLVSPFTEWKAYQTGVIDAEGNILVKRERFSREQAESFTFLDQLLLNVKKLLAKLPPSQTVKLTNFHTALWMIREADEGLIKSETQVIELTEKFSEFLPLLKEEVMSAGGGHIAGIGIGNQSEPGISKQAQKSYTWANAKVFVVPTEKFLNARVVKNPYYKYSKYVGDDEEGEEIRQFGRKNPKSSIILQDKQTGAMMYLRRANKI